MSVIVTGMDMPKRCGECKFKIYDRDRDSYICKITGEESSWGIGHTKEYCPLKSIDGFIEEIEKAKYLARGQLRGETNDLANGLDKAIEIIKEYCEVGDTE